MHSVSPVNHLGGSGLPLLPVSHSEQDLEGELKDARILCIRNLPESRILHSISGSHEIYVVEQVEGLKSELRLEPLDYGNVLNYCNIGIEISGAPEDILACIAERADGIGSEQRCIEELVHNLAVRSMLAKSGLTYVAAAKVRAIGANAAKRVIGTAVYRERGAALDRKSVV